MGETVIAKLAEIYPQLYLNPDIEPLESYKEVVLKGQEPAHKDLSWFCSDPRDKEELLDTPVGKVQVVTLYNRRGFEQFVRSMMAVKEGPDAPVPASQGASTLFAFNWPRIHAHKKQFLEEQRAAGVLLPDWGAEWKRFTAVKANYMDQIVVLVVGPYSAVEASRMGCSEEEWLACSDTIRKNHELTHVICRTLYPDQVNAVWDELVADAIGIYACYGEPDIEMEKVFLGISGDAYTGGRLENYAEDPVSIVSQVNKALDGIAEVIRAHKGEAPFAMIAHIQARQPELYS